MSFAGSTPLIYTPEQRERRDHTVWTLVQGVLAPLQFLVFLVSIGLILRALWWQGDMGWAQASVVVKTVVLYIIMVTGSMNLSAIVMSQGQGQFASMGVSATMAARAKATASGMAGTSQWIRKPAPTTVNTTRPRASSS